MRIHKYYILMRSIHNYYTNHSSVGPHNADPLIAVTTPRSLLKTRPIFSVFISEEPKVKAGRRYNECSRLIKTYDL